MCVLVECEQGLNKGIESFVYEICCSQVAGWVILVCLTYFLVYLNKLVKATFQHNPARRNLEKIVLVALQQRVYSHVVLLATFWAIDRNNQVVYIRPSWFLVWLGNLVCVLILTR